MRTKSIRLPSASSRRSVSTAVVPSSASNRRAFTSGPFFSLSITFTITLRFSGESSYQRKSDRSPMNETLSREESQQLTTIKKLICFFGRGGGRSNSSSCFSSPKSSTRETSGDNITSGWFSPSISKVECGSREGVVSASPCQAISCATEFKNYQRNKMPYLNNW